MHAVVNRLPIKEDADWDEIGRRFQLFADETRASHPGLKSAVVIKLSQTEGVFVGVYADMATLQHVSANVAAPWFAENIRQYLSGPTVRSVGDVVGGVV